MAELVKDVEAEWFDAGHLGGIASPATGLRFTQRMLEFAEQVTVGRPSSAPA